MMSIKDGVKVNGLHPETIIALIVAQLVYAEYDVECVITEGTGGKHGTASLHYVGYAIDLRIRNIPVRFREVITNKIREKLGTQYDVVLEKDHIHIEFQPKEQ